MFQPKKMIPSLAAAALSLTGCGDSSDNGGGSGGVSGTGGSGATGGTAGTGGATLQSVQAFCSTLAQCYGYSPDEYEYCIDYGVYAAETSAILGPACAGTFLSYIDCIAALECSDIGGPADIACMDAFDAGIAVNCSGTEG